MKIQTEKLFNKSTFFILLILLGFLTTSCSRSMETSTNHIENEVQLTNANFSLQIAPVIDSIRFEHLSVEDGISVNETLVVLQDRLGYLWFGTKSGLNRYDGREFSVYKHDPNEPNSLSDDWILALHEDDEGMIWIGTLNGGLDRYDPVSNQYTNFIHDPDKPDSLSHNEVLTIFEDSDHNLWFGTRNGLNRLNDDGETFTHYQLDSNNPQNQSVETILSIAETHDGSLWVGTDGIGLARFDRLRQSHTLLSHNPSNTQGLSDDHIWVIFEDSDNILWFGTDAGLDRYDPRSNEFINFQHEGADPDSLSDNAVRAIYEDPSGALWIGTEGDGLNRFDQERGTFTHYQHDPDDPNSLSHQAVRFIYQDREGILWIGTKGGGELNFLYLGSLSFTTFSSNPDKSNGLSDENIAGIHEDQQGNIWVGSKGGLNSYDPDTGHWQNYLHDPVDPGSVSSNNIGDVYVDDDGMIWVGTYDNALDRYNLNTGEFTHYPDGGSSGFVGNIVNEIIQDSQGVIWIATIEGGVNRYDRNTDHFIQIRHEPDNPNSISSDAVISLHEDSKGFLWAGTFTAGLNKIDLENDLITRYQAEEGNSNSLSHNLVASIYEDQQGILWVGTAGGLNKFDPHTETFIQYRIQEGLPGEIILGILEDDEGILWMSTNHGISSFNPQTEEFTNFERHDGVQSNEFNSFSYHETENGQMFFGGIRGLNTFYPDQITNQNQFIPPIVLTRFTQGGEDLISEQDPNSVHEITIKWPNNYFEFEFAALSFVQPGKNQYAYILEGFDNDRNYTRNQGIGRYTNLPGGNYTLKLFGSNHDGVWNETGHQIVINVVPPYWQTSWFYVILSLFISGLGYSGYRLRVRNLESRGKELAIQVEQRTSELMQIQAELKQTEMEKAISEERNRLARDLHDSVTQSIYSLTLLAEAGQRMIRSGDHKQAESNQIRLGEISQQALQEMRLLVYELRPQVLRSEGLVGALEHRLAAVERRAGINARLHVDEEIEIPSNFEEELFHLSMEALNNSLKHAGASEVTLSLYTDNGTLILGIEDNGRGFDPKLTTSQGGMGLSSMAERAEKIGGSLSIKSEAELGTIITVSVPLKRETKSSNLNPEENHDK